MQTLKGDHLRMLRHMKGFDQERLAKELGIHQSTISAVELGKRNPGKKLAQKIWDYFALTDEEFHALDQFVEVFHIKNWGASI